MSAEIPGWQRLKVQPIPIGLLIISWFLNLPYNALSTKKEARRPKVSTDIYIQDTRYITKGYSSIWLGRC